MYGWHQAIQGTLVLLLALILCPMTASTGLPSCVEVASLLQFVLPLLTPAAKLDTVHEFVFHPALT